MDSPPADQIPFRFLGGKGTFNAGASVWLYGLCLLLSLPFAYVFLIHAPWQCWRARSWVETPCTIISAKMVRADSVQWRYREQVVYEYVVANLPYRSEKIKILNFQYRYRTNRGDFAGDLQARFPPGGQSLCYVNPHNPAESLLNRDLQPGEFFYLPFILILMVVGVYGLWHRWNPFRIPARK